MLARLLWTAALVAGCGKTPSSPALDAPVEPPDVSEPGAKRIVILLIGDGMGRAHMTAAAHYAHGTAGPLFMETLGAHGTVITSGPSGTTDSAAAATTMATGARTWNGSIGIDRDDASVETVVELAHRLGMPAGVVSTSAIPHATPAAFTAHRDSRQELTAIADDQAMLVKPDVMLGGGAQYFLPAGPGSMRSDDGLLDDLERGGYAIARTSAELASARAELPLAGIFAAEHLAYTTERTPGTTEPTLKEMALAAIERLDRSPTGFFLMIEGSRIDMASHGNLLPEMIGELLAFDETVKAVADWSGSREDVTVLVTADHECGGLEVVRGNGAGMLPTVTWRWPQHTNAPVDVFARGPGSDVLRDQTVDHRAIHRVIASRLSGAAFAPPASDAVPDGRLVELAHVAATQTNTSGFGAGFNQLDALHLAADARGLEIGIAGVFQKARNAVVVLVDVDFGASTGPARLAGALTDTNGRADAILSALSLASPGVAGFGADLAFVSWGTEDPWIEQTVTEAGIRGLRPPYGQPNDLGWYGFASNFGDGTKSASGAPATPAPDRGWEVHVPWSRLYPAGFPPGARLAVAAVLVNDDGGFTSNQALPPFPANTANPGRTITALPGIAVFTVDGNNDGVVDPITSSTVMP